MRPAPSLPLHSFFAHCALCSDIPTVLLFLCNSMFHLVVRARTLKQSLPQLLQLQSLWGPNDDTYDTTDYYM
jgi:hypothetical protein